MATQKQTDANRRNALLSTGPRTEEGKQSSRQNAFRHGLTAETVIGLEDAAEYAAFEAEILTEHDPQSTVERELTLRMSSLLWRLRRASLIESGLLEIQCEPPIDDHDDRPMRISDAELFNGAARSIAVHSNYSHHTNGNQNPNSSISSAHNNGDGVIAPSAQVNTYKKQSITRRFLQLAELPSAPLERVGRYEAGLWRQFLQALFALDGAKRHRMVASRHRFTPHIPQW